MKLDGIKFEGFKSIPVNLSGNWIDNVRREWRGLATSPEPLVGMSFLVSDGHCEWCKSEKEEPSPEVRFVLFPYDKAGMDVQVNFSVGHGGRRWRSMVPSPSYRPKLSTSRPLETARIYSFATVDGVPPVELFVLFLARTDVETSRNTLWRVRERLAIGLQEPFRHWLTYGRTGTDEG